MVAKKKITVENRHNNEEYCWEVITPKKAKKYLETNMDNNRKIKRQVVARYARDMKNGHWEVDSTDNKITFNSNGELVDGQHRLKAIIESGVSLDMRVFRNVDATVFDKGSVRTTRDILIMDGKYIDVTNNEVATAKLLAKRLTNSRMTTDAEVKVIFNRYYGYIQTAAKICGRSNQNARLGKNAPCMAATFLALMDGMEEEKLIKFWDMVNSGFPSGDLNYYPAIILKRQLEQIKIGGLATKGASVHNIKFNITTQALWDFKNNNPRQKAYSNGISKFEKMQKAITKEIKDEL